MGVRTIDIGGVSTITGGQNNRGVTIMDSWAVTYVFPSYRSDPDSLPIHSDYHKFAYAD
jgi:hypothetical protein